MIKPQSMWPSNRGLDRALKLLRPIKEQYGEGLTWSDLIVLGGMVALEQAGAGRSQEAREGSKKISVLSGWSFAEVGWTSKTTMALQILSNRGSLPTRRCCS